MTDSHNKDTEHTKSEHDNSGKQGFASMPKEKVQEIARKGGQASHGTTNESETDAEDSQTGKAKKSADDDNDA